jgi:hypothetical protein
VTTQQPGLAGAIAAAQQQLAGKRDAGLGWYGRGHGSGIPGPLELLEMGSPRLALARALGVPFAPWLINCVALFPTVDTQLVPDVGSDTKLTQDAWVDSLIFRAQILRTPTNQFDTLSDFFLNYQSGIKAKLAVVGAPRYEVAPKFTPISTLSDMVGGAHWPNGWIVTYNENFEMQFATSFNLPAAPLEVTATFRLWAPIGEGFVKMDAETAIRRLADECGITCSPGYCNQQCR